MPIRMTKDDNGGDSQDNFPGGGGGGNRGGGGGGGLLAFLPMLLGLFFKYPKVGIIILLIGGSLYYFGGGCGGGNGINRQSNASALSTGCDMKQEVYDQAEVFEPLADNIKNPLPEKISLEQFAPQRLNQGQQGSCVGWGSAYAARTILYAEQTGKDATENAFSPSFMYNQISLEGCQGSYIQRAVETMQGVGALPLSQFEYTDEDCSRKPDMSQKRAAGNYRIKGFQRLSKAGEDYKTDMLAIKQYLAQGSPVIIGNMVGGSFMQDMMGKDKWIPTKEDYDENGFGGHCMCVIGYDDFKFGNEGGFQLMNSWGSEWGNKGIAWIRYKDFEYFNKEAYALYPMGTGEKYDENKLSVKFGLIDNESKTEMALVRKNENVFETQQPIKKGARFKIEVTNNIECYTYVFGMDTDASSYVLFPYTKKHSPYCGITGTRLFPRDYSLTADNIGNKDFIAIVVTKKPIDYNAMNAAINNSRSGTYAAKVNEAFQDELISNIQFMAGNTISLDCDVNGKNAAAIIIEVDKK